MKESSHFTPKARHALNRCPEIAAQLGHTYIGSEHLLLSLSEEEDSVAAHFLEKKGVHSEKLRNAIADFAGIGSPSAVSPADMTPRFRRILEKADEIDKKDVLLGTEHLLRAILSERDSVACRLLRTVGVDATELAKELGAFYNKQSSGIPSYTSPLKNTVYLQKYGRDLTEMGRAGKLDPLIGREEELARVIRILSRRTKNNPCLIGEPGVGKTAIAEGLALAIAKGQVPDGLKDHGVIMLDLCSMIAGAKYRGEFEDRLKGVLEEVSKTPRIILFIDEMHMLVGAGAAEGAVDAANILKPALARGELKLIGATTGKEYRQHIEKDAALSRRFGEVFVCEPTERETVAILQGLKEKYEAHHGLSVSDEAIESAVHLAARYLPERFFPDKAIDLLDEAAAAKRVSQKGEEENEAKQKAALAALCEEKLRAVVAENFTEAAALREKEKELRAQIDDKKTQNGDLVSPLKMVVLPKDIACILSKQTGIPVGKLEKSEEKKLANLEKEIDKRIVGQEEAKKALCAAVRRARLGFHAPTRPMGCFLFIGPSGVGKTALCYALAACLYDSEDAVIRLDMSEYMEKHSVARLIGSPPGYVGFEEGGQLTERVRRRPYSVVIFDEIEKAHPDVSNLLLQVMENGTLTDSSGKKVDFTGTILVLTSNIGSDSSSSRISLGFNAEETKGNERENGAIKNFFRPEFLNRLDDIIRFHPLSDLERTRIAELMLTSFGKRAAAAGLQLSFDESIAAFIARKGSEEGKSARPLQRAIATYLEDALSSALLAGELSGKKRIAIRLKGDSIALEEG